MGTSKNPTAILPATFAVYLNAANLIWKDSTPSASVVAASTLTQNVVTQDVIQTVANATISKGSVEYTALWYPLTPDSSLVAV